MDKDFKYGKRVLSALYVLFLVNVIVNVSLAQLSMSTTVVSTRIISFCLSFLLAGGVFLISTVIQAVVYHIRNRASMSTPVITVFETVKIIFTAFYIYMIDCRNINFSRADGVLVSGFLLSGISIFAVTAVCEIALLAVMQLNKIKQATGE